MPYLPTTLLFPSFLRAGRAGDGRAVGALGRDISTKCPTLGRAVGASLPGRKDDGTTMRQDDDFPTIRRKRERGASVLVSG